MMQEGRKEGREGGREGGKKREREKRKEKDLRTQDGAVRTTQDWSSP